MASDGSETQDLAEGTHEPRECMACRGTGRVVSNLGGSPSTVECPWCGGSGLRPPEADAQAHWGEGAGEGEPADSGSSEAGTGGGSPEAGGTAED